MSRNKTKLILGTFAAGVMAVAWLPSQAEAAPPVATLKQVQSGGGRVELQFDHKVSLNQVKTEFFNDVVQLSLSDVSVYPAKIAVLPEAQRASGLLKVFAYQYAPRLVRCRITVKGKADSFKDRLKVVAEGNRLALRISGSGGGSGSGGSEVAIPSAAAMRIQPGAGGDRSPVAQAPVAPAPKATAVPATDPKSVLSEVKINDAEERALLERVISQPAPQAPKLADGTPTKDQVPVSASAPVRKTEARAPTPLPSFWGVLIKLMAVIALFGAIAWAVKRFGLTGKNRPAWLGQFGKKNEAWVEVLSTHHLGPKKSISVVKVMGRVLVLGVTEESINLISQLSGEGDEGDLDLSELGVTSPGKGATSAGPSIPVSMHRHNVAASSGAGAMAAGPAVFADLLSSESSKPATASGPSAIRDQIRSRLEGLKQL